MYAPVGQDESITVVPRGVLGIGIEETSRGKIRDDGRERACLIEYRENNTWATGAKPIGAPRPSNVKALKATGTSEHAALTRMA